MVIPRVNISLFIEDRGKNKAAKKNYFFRVVTKTFYCVEEKRKNKRSEI